VFLEVISSFVKAVWLCPGELHSQRAIVVDSNEKAMTVELIFLRFFVRYGLILQIGELNCANRLKLLSCRPVVSW
jgi:hypothetical protein